MNDDVTMFGLSYSIVSLVAIVRDIQFTSTKIKYRLEDHTGQIEAYFWVESDTETKAPKVTKNAYARVIGNVRNVAESKGITIYHAEEIENINEVTTHLLEVLYARYKSEALQKGGSSVVGAMASTSIAGAINGNSSTAQPMETDDAAATDGSSYGLTGKNLLVFKAIKEFGSSESGMHRGQLEAKFPHIPKSEMNVIIEYMSNEGMIYTTIDSDHFLSCD